MVKKNWIKSKNGESSALFNTKNYSFYQQFMTLAFILLNRGLYGKNANVMSTDITVYTSLFAKEGVTVDILADQSHDLVLVAKNRPHGYTVTAVNEAFCKTLNIPHEKLVGMTFAEAIGGTGGRDSSRIESRLRDALAENKVFYEDRFVFPTGLKTLAMTITTIPNDCEDHAVLITAHDVSEQRAAEKELEKRTLHDPLTGLANRALLLDRIRQALYRLERHDEFVAVLSIDLDRFKIINESFGHSVGDRLLKDVAKRIRSITRPSDTVARVGGDDFVVLCEALEDISDAEQVADRLYAVLEAPFTVQERELRITASVGVIISSGGDDPEALVAEADGAMYHAKDQGRARHVFLHEPLRERVVAKLDLELDMQDALRKQGFHLVYQPIVDAKTEKVVGAEALLRWIHPERGPLAPDQFIAIAEDSGLIIPIGAWVAVEACVQMKAWNDMRPADDQLYVSVNLSARQLCHGEISTVVAEALQISGLEPHNLELEITETAIARNPDAAARYFLELKSLGVQMALDDFGTGYSSLGHLRTFAVNTVKIDRSFITGAGMVAEDSAIVKAVADIADALHMHTVAEGVETDIQLQAVRAANIDRIQGYYYSRPLAPEDFWEFTHNGSN